VAGCYGHGRDRYVAGCYDHGRDMWQAAMIMVVYVAGCYDHGCICGRLL